MVDRKLTGQAHIKSVVEKAPKLIGALKTMMGSTWGASLHAGRELYLRVTRPALTYGALLWFKPADILKGGKGMAKKL